jgi:hypothetical protein
VVSAVFPYQTFEYLYHEYRIDGFWGIPLLSLDFFVLNISHWINTELCLVNIKCYTYTYSTYLQNIHHKECSWIDQQRRKENRHGSLIFGVGDCFRSCLYFTWINESVCLHTICISNLFL